MLEKFYVFIIRNDIPIYILCALGLFWYLNQLRQAQAILRRAMFALEREHGTALRNTAVTLVTLFLLIIGGVYYVNANIAPTLPPGLLKPPTPTPNFFSTPLASPTALGTPVAMPPTATIALIPTATLRGQGGGAPATPTTEGSTTPTVPAATAVPLFTGPVPTPFVDCTFDLNINSPRDGDVVDHNLSFFGTVGTPNFQYYKMEINGPETNGQWASLLGRNIDQRVMNGFLGSVNLQDWVGGDYVIRLTAVDTGNNETGSCTILLTLN